MVFDPIETLKRQYTDKYVVVDASRPELARFRDTTGVIKTVNMSGRALVQFDQREDIGWYDIELGFLKLVDKPLPKPEKKEERPAKTAPTGGAATKSAPPSKPAAMPKPKAEVAATAPAAGQKMSTADILAAARAKAAGGGPAAAKPAAGPGARPGTSAAEAGPAAKKTTAEILAAARTKVAPEGAGSPPAAEVAATPSADQAIPQAPVKSAPAVAAKAASSGALPTTTAEKLAWCRAHDAK